MTGATILDKLGLTGENPGRVSVFTPKAFDWLRIIFGLIVLYDAWASLSFPHKQQMSQFMGLAMESPWLHVTVAVNSFIEIALAVSLLSGQGIAIMGCFGVAYGLVVWLVAENGGDFGQDATDPGIGLPYAVTFLYVVAADRLRADPDVAKNQLLSLARVAFGLLWAYDAILKLQPYFIDNYLSYIPGGGPATDSDAANAAGQMMGAGMGSMMSGGMGRMMAAYDHAWVVTSQALRPQTVAWGVALAEVALAAGLIAGRGLRILGPLGLALSFVIWSVPEQFGGPYSMGVSEMPMALIGVAVIYMVALGYVWVLYNPLDLVRARHPSKPGSTEQMPHKVQQA